MFFITLLFLTEKLVNFVKKATKEVNSFGVKYDFGSIMHYSQNAFSKNPLFADTIIPKTHVNIVPVAQRKKISNLDVVQTNLLYKCPCKSSIKLFYYYIRILEHRITLNCLSKTPLPSLIPPPLPPP